jgi:hypothetical protein
MRRLAYGYRPKSTCKTGQMKFGSTSNFPRESELPEQHALCTLLEFYVSYDVASLRMTASGQKRSKSICSLQSDRIYESTPNDQERTGH